MNKKWIFYALLNLAVITVMAFALVSCAPPIEDGSVGFSSYSGKKPKDMDLSEFMNRYIDKEAGVVCYIYSGQAVSCLPIDQTNLR